MRKLYAATPTAICREAIATITFDVDDESVDFEVPVRGYYAWTSCADEPASLTLEDFEYEDVDDLPSGLQDALFRGDYAQTLEDALECVSL
jgi:hypothetical protein